MIRRTLFFILISILLITLVGCGKDKEEEVKGVVKVAEETKKIIPNKVSEEKIVVSTEATLPKYTVLDEDIYDAPIKAQVAIDLLVSKDISKEGLTALLKHLYEKNRQRGGFKYHKKPTNIYIYAYPSREHADSGSGQWVGMLAKSYDDPKPKITVNEEFLARLREKPEEKFGLTESKRRSIFSEIVKVEDRAWQEAEKKYPDLNPGDQGYSRTAGLEQMKRSVDFMNELVDKYEDELATKHGLTREQLNEIGIEGAIKNWPMPE